MAELAEWSLGADSPGDCLGFAAGFAALGGFESPGFGAVAFALAFSAGMFLTASGFRSADFPTTDSAAGLGDGSVALAGFGDFAGLAFLATGWPASAVGVEAFRVSAFAAAALAGAAFVDTEASGFSAARFAAGAGSAAGAGLPFVEGAFDFGLSLITGLEG